MGYNIEIDMSLGGFAEDPRDIDGTEEEMEMYNRCLADEYYNAFCGEDYERLGKISAYLVYTISTWYTNYDDKNYATEIQEGLMQTINNRTFIDAIIADKRGDYAEVFIHSGNYDPRLFASVILYGDAKWILSSGVVPELDKDQYFKLVENVFSELEKVYLSLNEVKAKITLLEKVKTAIESTRYNKEFGGDVLPSENAVIKDLRNNTLH